MVLRVWIGTYSTDANDSHLHVIHEIMATGELPATQRDAERGSKQAGWCPIAPM